MVVNRAAAACAELHAELAKDEYEEEEAAAPAALGAAYWWLCANMLPTLRIACKHVDVLWERESMVGRQAQPRTVDAVARLAFWTGCAEPVLAASSDAAPCRLRNAALGDLVALVPELEAAYSAFKPAPAYRELLLKSARWSNSWPRHVADICIGLAELDLPVLLLIEIVKAVAHFHATLAPPLHLLWRAAKCVKDCRRVTGLK